MPHLNLQHVGQITEADIEFGDLTVFVGAQATGKSIVLQFLKLMADMGHVQAELGKYGLDWDRNLDEFLDIYFGEGMHSIWREHQSTLTWSNKAIDIKKLVSRKRKDKRESLFFIPAQRVLALREGWPRPFSDFAAGDPFAVREFSERLRVLVEQEFAGTEQLFPQPRRLKQEFRKLLQEYVFADFDLQIDKVHSQKRFVLGINGETLPYMVWSAGQREFVPLLLGLYWLMPSTKVSMRGDIEWVVLEEPEMGLHPRAISVVLLMVFELVMRGYKVCISTHSPHVLEAIWALHQLKQLKNTKRRASELLEAFNASKSQSMQKLAETMLKKCVKVFYFDRENGSTSDISELDPTAEEEGESGWGGLTEFSGRVNEVVARSVANA